ncbi:MAG: hypothetical protein IPP30_04340 [Flavobacterium sp.]|nr:hypothetical protein [Flavobacterium sp.]
MRLNILSGLESGALFGANGNATNGGIVYNPITLPNSMLFRTNGNVNRMVISNDGNIALGSFIPTLPLQFPHYLEINCHYTAVLALIMDLEFKVI